MIWGESLPVHVNATLETYVSVLRRKLSGANGDGRGLITTAARGLRPADRGLRARPRALRRARPAGRRRRALGAPPPPRGCARAGHGIGARRRALQRLGHRRALALRAPRDRRGNRRRVGSDGGPRRACRAGARRAGDRESSHSTSAATTPASWPCTRSGATAMRSRCTTVAVQWSQMRKPRRSPTRCASCAPRSAGARRSACRRVRDALPPAPHVATRSHRRAPARPRGTSSGSSSRALAATARRRRRARARRG